MSLNKTQLLKALSLHERVSYFKEPPTGAHDIQNSYTPLDNTVPEKLKRWKTTTKNTENTRFPGYLDQLGITEPQFQILLDSPDRWASHSPQTYPPWLERMVSLYDSFPWDNHTYISDIFKKTIPTSVFFDCAEPIIADGQQRLHNRIITEIKDIEKAPFKLSELEYRFAFSIGFTLFDIMNRTMVLELNAARVMGKLQGSTSEERFAHFAQKLRTPEGAEAIIEEYPVLFRQILQFMDRWVNNYFKLAKALYNDWPELQRQFGIKDMSSITKIQSNAGDRHNKGQTVCIVYFADGTKVVYKPRSLMVDIHFQELLEWFNKQEIVPPLKTLTLLNRSDYGWVEFIPHLPCNTIQELERYHERVGALIAILYTLNATDFHYENIIASAEHPVLIDLESLFHYTMHLKADDSVGGVFNEMEKSVLKINLLPFRYYIEDKYKGMDLGGMSSIDGNMTPKPVPSWHAEGTDEMQLRRVHMAMSGQKNLPKIGTENITAIGYVEKIQDAFRKCHAFLEQNRESLLKEGSILEIFKEDSIRVLFRPTMVYTQLLESSFHPHYLRDQADRDYWFDHIYSSVGASEITPPMISAEINALNHMDVPFFTTEPQSQHLKTDHPQPITNFFPMSGLDTVKNKLAHFDESDRNKQCWYIRASVATILPADEITNADEYSLNATPVPVTPKQFLESAQSIVRRLETLAYRKENTVNWIGLFLNPANTYDVRPLAIDLYGGISGITLFLGYWQAVTKDNQAELLFEDSLNSLLIYINRYLSSRFDKYLGFFDGWSGLVHTLYHLGTILKRPSLLEKTDEVCQLLKDILLKHEQSDILNGSAGSIVMLTNLYALKQDKQILELAVQLGEQLETNAVAMEHGKGWLTRSKQPLTGFSHGAAGIAYALYRLYFISGETRFLELANSAIAYEQSLFIPEKNNWLDLRDYIIAAGNERMEKAQMVAWCNGSAGIGLSRAAILNLFQQHDHSKLHETKLKLKKMEEELRIAVSSTLNYGFGKNHSLCHGDLGNLDFLFIAAQTLNDHELKNKVEKLSASILASIQENGLICGVPLKVENPGLMTGIAGIGYQLLRLAYPGQVPSILMMDGPFQ